jgi:hypothetical protein
MKKLLLLSLAFLLSACATIPTGSPLYVLDEVTSTPGVDPVRVIVRPPSKSMSPQELIDGFIAAQASMEDNYAVARLYLTDSYSDAWKPTSVRIIDANGTGYSSLFTSALRVTTQEIGALGKNARLSWWDQALTQSYVFTFVETSQGYRLNRVPDLIFLSALDFSRNYVAAPLYFMNADFTSLVPDIAWVANAGSTVPTRVARLLLNGPDGPLKNSVQTAIPRGTELSPATVTVTSGEAALNLDARALQVTDAQRTAMMAQVAWTLSALNGINAVRLTIANQAVSTQKFVLTRNDFANLAADQIPISRPLFSVASSVLMRGSEPEGEVIGQLDSAQVIAVSDDGAQTAFVTSGRAFIAPLTAAVARTQLLNNVVDLDFDSLGRLWLVTANGQLWIRDGVRPVQRVLEAPKGQRVVAISNSPDGARIAVVLEGPTGRFVRLFGVTTTGTSVSLGEPVRLELSLATVSDVAWLDSLQIVVVGQRGVEESSVFRISLLSGQPAPVGGPSGIAQLTAAYGQPPALLTSQGVLWILMSNQWQSVREASAIAYAA